MSLDVYLTLPTIPKDWKPNPEQNIPIREDGRNKLITRKEWDERFPDREPIPLDLSDTGGRTVFDYNITHNLNKMAKAAGVYECMWRPDEHEMSHARDLIKPLEKGLAVLVSDPVRFKKYNPFNGWGDYKGLVKFCRKYLAACKEWPNAEVSVWR